MNINHGAEESPGASLPVNMKHPENLIVKNVSSSVKSFGLSVNILPRILILLYSDFPKQSCSFQSPSQYFSVF